MIVKEMSKRYKKSVLDFYTDLYVARLKTEESKKEKKIKAVKSWIKLKKCEKNLVQKKYDEYVYSIYKKQAERNKNMESYPEKKPTISISGDVNVGKSNDTKVFSDRILELNSMEIAPHLGMGVPSSYSNQINVCNTTCTSGNVHSNSEDIPEPDPPKFRTAKDLYVMLQSVEPNLTESWLYLPDVKKRRYQAAVSKIKKEYLENYMKYIKSKPSKFLYDLLRTTASN